MASGFEEWMEQRYPNWRGDAFTTPVAEALLAQLREAYEAGLRDALKNVRVVVSPSSRTAATVPNTMVTWSEQ